MILDLPFQVLKRIALAGRVKKHGITLVVGPPLIPDPKTDVTGTRGEVRFTVDEANLRPPRASGSSSTMTARMDRIRVLRP